MSHQLINLAVQTMPCTACGASVNEPCRPYRVDAVGAYGQWFAHSARLWAIDRAHQLGFQAGAAWNEGMTAGRATRVVDNHEAFESEGGWTACSCGWPEPDDFRRTREAGRQYPDYERHLFEAARIL